MNKKISEKLIHVANGRQKADLVLKNARMTGNYVRDYEGKFEGSLEKTDRDSCVYGNRGRRRHCHGRWHHSGHRKL